MQILEIDNSYHNPAHFCQFDPNSAYSCHVDPDLVHFCQLIQFLLNFVKLIRIQPFFWSRFSLTKCKEKNLKKL